MTTLSVSEIYQRRREAATPALSPAGNNGTSNHTPQRQSANKIYERRREESMLSLPDSAALVMRGLRENGIDV